MMPVTGGSKRGISATMARVHFADARPLRPMVDRTRSKQPLEGLVAIDINVAVVEILEAAKISLKDGRAVLLPLP